MQLNFLNSGILSDNIRQRHCLPRKGNLSMDIWYRYPEECFLHLQFQKHSEFFKTFPGIKNTL